jgi:hypothetical protein
MASSNIEIILGGTETDYVSAVGNGVGGPGATGATGVTGSN